jgi:hypothetical protein
MVEVIFTLDYEIYGNGAGALNELVYKPAERLRKVFGKWDTRCVIFVEVAEFERIDAFATDPAISNVKRQIKELYADGFEIGLHLHPQWCNARYEKGRWFLNFSEYNLCNLPEERIASIVEGSLAYLRHLVDQADFTPISFRAGNWLFQPTETAAIILAQNGIKIDSSVFKGGLQHSHHLDYRRALGNGYYWSFKCDVNEAYPEGPWIELPIYTEMVPFWRMATFKRLRFNNGGGTSGRGASQKFNRALDLMRFRYPLKLDFCRMTLTELVLMMGKIIRDDQRQPDIYKPIVAIGHTKDLADTKTIDDFLSFLNVQNISVITFESVYSKLAQERPAATVVG